MSALTEKRVAVVGPGEAGRTYLELLAEVPELRLAGVVAHDRGSRAIAAPRFRSIRELLAREGAPHVALICSPARDHATHAAALLRAGADVLIAPPLARDPCEADRIAALAERAGRVAYTAAPLRVLPALRKARRLIDSGHIGRLCAIECELSDKRSAAAPGGGSSGVWLDSGPHAIDVVEALAGPIERIRMLETSKLQAGPVEDEVYVEVEHRDRLLSRLRLSWNGERNAPIARCIGDRGELTIGRAQTVLHTEDGDEALPGEPYSEHEAYREVLRDFLATCRAPERPLDHGAQSVAWIHAAYRSLGRWELC